MSDDEKRVLRTLADVANHLGAWEPTSKSIAHRVYEDTECGAWAEVEDRQAWRKERETWRVDYARIDGAWQTVAAFRQGAPVKFSRVPEDVRNYFLFGTMVSTGMQDHLTETAKGASTLTIEEPLDVRYPAGRETVFRVGSIVEGTDATTDTYEVVLPCAAECIDDAIEGVEREARAIWNDTHGCEDCAKLYGFESDGGAHVAVHDDCPTCQGHGIVI